MLLTRNIRWVYCWVILIGLTGLISRVLPVFDKEKRLLQQFPTEDGYLMLTISRYLSQGLGLSTSDGTIPTNGVQPLTTFIWALGYFINEGDKIEGVLFAHIFQLLISILTSILLYKLVIRIFHNYEYKKAAALIIAVLTFSSPHLIPHTMNFLETGNYLTIILFVVLIFIEERPNPDSVWSIKKSILVGLVLGVMFWVRNDAVFVIFACCLVYISNGLNHGVCFFWRRVSRALVFGSTSVLVASPWLIFNYLNFGSIVPVSGRSEGIAEIFSSISSVPPALVEYITIFIPIPNAISDRPIVVLVSLLILAMVAFYIIFSWKKFEYKLRSSLIMGAIIFFCFVIYYGLFFGAKHFVSRYLIVTYPFFALLLCAAIIGVIRGKELKFQLYVKSIFVISAILIVGLNIRLYVTGIPHQHYQVVKWIDENVPDDTWVGAIQTGTLGYFHDRTINLDGKVNPDALAARLGEAYCPSAQDGKNPSTPDCLMHYVIEKELWYIADWVSIGDWIKIPPMDKYFELVLMDERNNLSVLRRHGAPRLVN